MVNMAIIRVGLGFYSGTALWPPLERFYRMNPCPFGLPEILTVAHMVRLTIQELGPNAWLFSLFTWRLMALPNHSKGLIALPIVSGAPETDLWVTPMINRLISAVISLQKGPVLAQSPTGII